MTDIVSDAGIDTEPASEEASFIADLEALPGHRWTTEERARLKEWLFRSKKESFVRRAQSRLSYSNDRQEAEDAWSRFVVEKLDHVLDEYDPLRGSPYRWVVLKFDFYCSNLNRQPAARIHEKTQSLEEVLLEVLPSGDPSRAYEARDLLRAAMRLLAPEEQRLFISRYVEEKSYIELARSLKIPVGTIRSRLFALRRNFKRAIHALSLPRVDNES